MNTAERETLLGILLDQSVVEIAGELIAAAIDGKPLIDRIYDVKHEAELLPPLESDVRLTALLTSLAALAAVAVRAMAATGPSGELTRIAPPEALLLCEQMVALARRGELHTERMN